MAGDAAPAAAAPELVGIGGWLVLVAIGQVLGPIRVLLSLGNYYVNELDSSLFETFPATVYGEVVLNVAFFAFSVFVAIMFFRHSWLFPRLYILQWILIAALPLIDAGWVAVTASAYSGESLSEYLTMDPKDIGQVIGAVIIGPIWIAYILRSRRVKNTFVK